MTVQQDAPSHTPGSTGLRRGGRHDSESFLAQKPGRAGAGRQRDGPRRHRHRPDRRFQRPRRLRRQGDRRRRQALHRPRQRHRRHQRRADHADLDGRQVRAGDRRRQRARADHEEEGAGAVPHARHAAQPGHPAAAVRVRRAAGGAVHRRDGAAQAGQPVGLQRARELPARGQPGDPPPEPRRPDAHRHRAGQRLVRHRRRQGRAGGVHAGQRHPAVHRDL